MYVKALGAISLAGIGAVYSFILSYSYFRTGVCSFATDCPEVFGVPVCVFGFLGFVAACTCGGLMLGLEDRTKAIAWAHRLYWLSLGGMLFALYFSIQELFLGDCRLGTCPFSFTYPSCLYGLVIFFGLFWIARSLDRDKI